MNTDDLAQRIGDGSRRLVDKCAAASKVGERVAALVLAGTGVFMICGLDLLRAAALDMRRS
jgi:hypothetical protein